MSMNSAPGAGLKKPKKKKLKTRKPVKGERECVSKLAHNRHMCCNNHLGA